MKSPVYKPSKTTHFSAGQNQNAVRILNLFYIDSPIFCNYTITCFLGPKFFWWFVIQEKNHPYRAIRFGLLSFVSSSLCNMFNIDVLESIDSSTRSKNHGFMSKNAARTGRANLP